MNLNLTFGNLAAQLKRMADQIKKPDLSRPLTQIGELLVQDSQKSFQRATAPDGQPWPPLKQSLRTGLTLIRGQRKPLQKTGRLMSSIEAAVSHEPPAVSVGTKVPYGIYQQIGTRRIPPRRFLGISPRTGEKIRRVIVEAVLRRVQVERK